MSLGGGGGTAPQLPAVLPVGTLHARPEQQSEVAVHGPLAGEQLFAAQRSTPLESGKQGAPPQHSDEKAHCAPAAMQQPGWPV